MKGDIDDFVGELVKLHLKQQDQSIMKCDVDVRYVAPTMLRDIKERISARKIEVIGPLERKHFVWMTASILASLSAASSSGGSPKGEYDEEGPTILHLKCS